MRLFGLIALVILITGCYSDPVYLRQASTGQRAQCGPYSISAGIYGPFPASIEAATMKERGCVEDYYRQGYVRVME